MTWNHTEAAKKRIAEASSKRWADPAYRKRTADAMRGLKKSAETKAKMSEAQRNRPPASGETKEKIRQARLGTHLSEQTKQKLRARTCSPEVRAKISATKMGEVKSEETRARMSVAIKKHKRQHFLHPPEGCTCGPHRILPPTCIEVTLAALLSEFPDVRIEEPFNPYRVDAYLPPPYHLAFEADGPWHNHNRDRDRRRDAELLKEYNLPVVRLSSKELLVMAKEIG